MKLNVLLDVMLNALLNTLCGVVLMTTLLFAPEAFSQGKANKSETYKDIIEKAYNLSLQKDRQQALNILMTALQKENRSQPVQELRKAILDLSHVFLGDKAQQMYETGLSLCKTDLPQAINKFNEALRMEPDNMVIVVGLARVLIAKGDCGGAQELINKQLKLMFYDEDLKLAMAQSLVCQSLWSEYSKIFDGVEVRKSTQQKYWISLEVERNFKTKNFIKMQEHLEALKKLDSKYPEYSYWAWKMAHVLKRPATELAQKYVMGCKNISANLYRQYMIDPMLCRRVSEVESELKGTNGTSE